eukprot:m.122144 g.122144  ORF g.122144 m.122144 type:complete len:72 (+) comp13719_c1_seq3:1792-2007(+)
MILCSNMEDLPMHLNLQWSMISALFSLSQERSFRKHHLLPCFVAYYTAGTTDSTRTATSGAARNSITDYAN